MKQKVAYLPMREAKVETMFQKKGWCTTNDPRIEHDAVVFVGGADVTPFLYGERTLRCSSTAPQRDMFEIGVFKATPKRKPKIGICRGAQFLNVMCGGRMWQDVNNHAIGSTHEVMDFMTGAMVNVTSTHHQMMIPAEDAEIIAAASLATSKQCEAGKYSYTLPTKPSTTKDFTDPEVVYYSSHEALCFQPHPEYGKAECETYFWLLVQDYLFPKGNETVQAG